MPVIVMTSAAAAAAAAGRSELLQPLEVAHQAMQPLLHVPKS
jgi:hypothetical protein